VGLNSVSGTAHWPPLPRVSSAPAEDAAEDPAVEGCERGVGGGPVSVGDGGVEADH
jgi:hypothetical protein